MQRRPLGLLRLVQPFWCRNSWRPNSDLKLEEVVKRLAGFEALVLDDLGYVQQSRDEMEVLFTLLAERYERGSVILTSNLPFSQWNQIFKDPMTTAAAIDRLVHHSVIVELNVRELSPGNGEVVAGTEGCRPRSRCIADPVGNSNCR